MGLFSFTVTPSQLEKTMSKITSAKKPSEIVESSADTETASHNNQIPAIALAKFWLLEEGIAKKLGLRSTRSLNYQVLADHDRKNLFIALTKNDGAATTAGSGSIYFPSRHAWAHTKRANRSHQRPSRMPTNRSPATTLDS